MEFNKDRGTILRISFDIVYPNGQLKSVSMSLADCDKWNDVGIIALNNSAIESILAPALNKIKAGSGDTALKAFNSIQDAEALYKPALLIMHNGGTVSLECGGHGSSGHKEKGNAVQRFI